MVTIGGQSAPLKEHRKNSALPGGATACVNSLQNTLLNLRILVNTPVYMDCAKQLVLMLCPHYVGFCTITTQKWQCTTTA